MAVVLFLCLFTTFFLFLCFLSSIRSSKKNRAENTKLEPITIKQLLKKGNITLKALLVKKKKNSRQAAQLEAQLSLAGVPMKAEEFKVFQWFSVIISGGILYILTNEFFLLATGAVIGFFLPRLWLKQKQRKRIKQFNALLPGMLNSIIGSLKAGFSFLQSLQMVAEESGSPIKEEVQYVLKSLQYGTSMEDSLIQWKERMPSEDLSLLVEAILIQRQVGGNLAYLLEKIVDTNRERNKLENQIKTLTAQGRLSGLIISFLPIGLGAVIYVMNPDYIGTLFSHPIGQVMLIAGAAGQVIGFLFIRKITTIEV